MEQFEKKVARAIKLLQSIPQDGEIEISYSGGKDSDVILELAKMAGIKYRAIYKNTTIDPAGTIRHCKEKGVEIMQPKLSFYKIIEKKGFPTRRARFCCSELKEYKVLDRAVQGIRKSESIKRRDRYKEPEICRVFSKDSKAKIYLPILDWTDADVERFIKERGIKCHPLYYDEKGAFHVERRLGCIGCPMAAGNGKKELKQYPTVLRAMIRAGDKYLETHPNSSAKAKFGNACNMMYHNLFCTSFADYELKMSVDLWGGQLDTKEYLQEYFQIKL